MDANTAHRRTGMTLAELLIVIVIVGLLTALAFPAIDSLRSQSESAMLSLGTTLQAAQRESVARQHDVIVTFSGTGNQLQLIFDANNNGVQDDAERVRGIALDPMIVFGRGGAPARAFGTAAINLVGGGETLIFHRNGSTSASGGIYLTTTRGATGEEKRIKDTRALEIVRATGRIEWFRYNGSDWVRGF